MNKVVGLGIDRYCYLYYRFFLFGVIPTSGTFNTFKRKFIAPSLYILVIKTLLFNSLTHAHPPPHTQIRVNPFTGEF